MQHFCSRIKFYFNAMPIGAYRILGKIAKQFNEVIVTAYDLLEDKYVTQKCILGHKIFQVFHVGLETGRLVYKEFELIGTNPLESISLIYNNNTTPEVQTENQHNMGLKSQLEIMMEMLTLCHFQGLVIKLKNGTQSQMAVV